MPIKAIKPNPDNPRIIKDEKFAKLVQSIKDFPAMLELRPIVVNADHVVLGGNMRLKACQAAGLKDVPVVVASDLSADQQREFVIKDNVGFGEWEWDALANQWDAADLEAWGLDLPAVDAEPSAGLTDPDDVPETPAEPVTKPGDLVLEPFGGSGTTLLAAETTGRVAAVIELDPRYCDVIVRRWQQFTGRTATYVETGEPVALT